MSDKPSNPPAFPRNYRSDGHNGMTLRDYFAGQALAGMLCNGYMPGVDRMPMAMAAYELADKMLAERAKQEANNA